MIVLNWPLHLCGVFPGLFQFLVPHMKILEWGPGVIINSDTIATKRVGSLKMLIANTFHMISTVSWEQLIATRTSVLYIELCYEQIQLPFFAFMWSLVDPSQVLHNSRNVPIDNTPQSKTVLVWIHQEKNRHLFFCLFVCLLYTMMT